MISAFIPCHNFNESCAFYQSIGFSVGTPQEGDTKTASAVYANQGEIILQDFYVKEWAENTMMTLTVDDLESFTQKVSKYQSNHPESSVRLQPPNDYGWGLQIHLLDPSGVLWHVFQSKKSQPEG